MQTEQRGQYNRVENIEIGTQCKVDGDRNEHKVMFPVFLINTRRYLNYCGVFR